MAILYDSTFGKFVANNLFNPEPYIGTEFVISIHSGTQPTDADFISNWGTAHYYNTSDDTVGTSVLGYYGANSTQANSGANQLVIAYVGGESSSTPFTWTLNDTLYASNYKANGTASWAVIYIGDDFRVLTQSSFRYQTPYIICPVSNSAGSGVVKLTSTTVNGSLPNLDDISLNVVTT